MNCTHLFCVYRKWKPIWNLYTKWIFSMRILFIIIYIINNNNININTEYPRAILKILKFSLQFEFGVAKTFCINFFFLNRVTLLSNERLNELKSKHTLQTSWTTQTQKVGFINTSLMFCSKTFKSSTSSAFSIANHKTLAAKKIGVCLYISQCYLVWHMINDKNLILFLWFRVVFRRCMPPR